MMDIKSENCITALIDADSIIYIMAWNHRDKDDVDEFVKQLDEFVESLLMEVGARQYAGFFSAPSEKCFRTKIYKVRPYKGNRPEKPEWVKKWEPVVKGRLINHWGFIQLKEIEADDAVSAMQQTMVNSIICSPDKDLRQVPGNHFNYRDKKKFHVGVEEGQLWLATQMITGDEGDGVAGLVGFGPVKAAKLLQGKSTGEAWDVVKEQYNKYFGGSYYGQEIYTQTLATLKMLGASYLGCDPEFKPEQVLRQYSWIEGKGVDDGFDIFRQIEEA